MSANVLLIGFGDCGAKIADGLLRQGGVGRLVVGAVDVAGVSAAVAMLDSCHDTQIALEQVDALDPKSIEKLLLKYRPDLVIQAASLISPWSIIGRDHGTAMALNRAGIGIQLPAQLPIVMNIMQVVRDLGLDIPVANLSMPDFIHPILATRGLAPTVGLGNVSILHLRTMAAWKHRQQAAGTASESLIRVVGHHHQVYGVMQGTAPDDTRHKTRVYIGEEGIRDDGLAYSGKPFLPSPVYNVITAASALPVLGALLPNAAARRFSAPAPLGLPGGYPVKISQGKVSLDLPGGVDLADAKAFNQRIGALDGVAEIDAGGLVHFTESATEAVREIDPRLADVLDPWNMQDRSDRLRTIINDMEIR